MGIFGGTTRGQLRGNARPGLFGVGASATPSMVPVETQRTGLGTRILGQGWEGKLGAIGAMLMGDRNAVSNYHAMGRAEQMAQQQRAMELADAQRERSLDRQDWQWRQEWERNNPAPTALQRNVEYLEGRGGDLADNYLERMTDNSIWRQGPDGQFYRVDASGGMGGVPTAPVGLLTPIQGGSVGNGAGGF